jgi:hypothetical protein
VNVDQTRDDGLSRDIDHRRACILPTPAGPDIRDAIVLDHDIALLDYLVAFHGDDSRTAEHHRSARHVARGPDGDVDPLALVARQLGNGIGPRLGRGVGLARRFHLLQ